MKDDCELSYLLMASLFWVENEQETGYESFVRQYIPQIFTKLLTEEHCRHWQPEINQAIQRRNLELIRLVASMLKNNVYNSSLTPVMCGLLDPDCFFFVKNKHGNPPSYNSGTSFQSIDLEISCVGSICNISRNSKSDKCKCAIK